MDRIKAARAKAAQRIEDILQGRTVADVVVGDPDDDAAQMSTFTQRAPGADVPTSAELVRPQAHPQPAFVRGPSGNPRTTAFSSSPSSVVTTSSSASTLSKSNVGPTHCPGATHVARIRRARIAALTARVDALHRATAEAREDGSRVQERVLEQRALLERRRRNLADARILLAEREPGLAEDQWTHPSEKPLGLGPGAWPGDVKPHRDGFGVLFEPPRTLEMVRRELDLRKNEAKELAEELAQ